MSRNAAAGASSARWEDSPDWPTALRMRREITMGEVKSTLELVMERTRNMVFTVEEKREQTVESFRQSLNGLLQKYEDTLLTVDGFCRELSALRESSGINDTALVTEEVSRRVDPDGNNTARLALVEAVCGAKRAIRVASILEEYRQKADDLQTRSRERAAARLIERAQVSGSAVIPNLQNDREWMEEHRRLRDEALLRIKHEIAV